MISSTENLNIISQLTQQEFEKQKNTLNLIASENYPSPKVLNLLGSVWSNKYAEGYPGKRYYAGNLYTDELESYVQQLALQVFDTSSEYEVNVQVLSGSPANAMVFLTVLEYGETILSLNLSNGGHLSHLHQTSNWLKFFKLVNYDLVETDQGTFEIDLKDFEQKLIQNKPKLTIIGCSSYPRSYEFGEMCQLAHRHGSLVLADVAHINGLIAAGLHDSPFKPGENGADFVSMTTHKTLRGPRAAMLFFKKEWAKEINKTIFPGTSGGPHMNKIAAIGQSLMEIQGLDQYPDNRTFNDYSKEILATCKSLENSLNTNGLEIISPTQNHLCLVKLPITADSLEIQKRLESVGIITNRNVLPFDSKSAWRPSGLRLGTAALTSRGLTTVQAQEIGTLIADTIFERKTPQGINSNVLDLVAQLSWWY